MTRRGIHPFRLRARRRVQALIIVLWLGVMAWFVRYEAFPGFFAHSLPGYRALFRDSPLLLDSWSRIRMGDATIGYSHTQVDSGGEETSDEFLLENRTRLNLRIMGRERRIVMTAFATLDAVYRLQQFRFSLSSGEYFTRVHGVRAAGDRFDVRITTPSARQTLSIELPDDVVIYSPMTEMMLSRLRPGQQRRIKTFDPASLSVVDILVTAGDREPIVLGAATNEATRLTMDYNGMKITSWVDAAGRLLRQETPLGWTLESCSAQEALDLDQEPVGGTDILTALAVPCQGQIARPRNRKELRVRLSGPNLDGLALESPRQHVLRKGPGGAELLLERLPLPAEAPASFVTTNLVPYLTATPFVQSDAPAIREKVESLVPEGEAPAAAATALGDWVYRNVAKNPAVSLPSALDVLRVMEGDCNEHTYLYTALARAAGLPTKIKVGLVYLNGAFYYHAWPAVYLGRWYELDPTLGQTAVDATHIALLEGELSEQLRLMSIVGQLKVEVLPGAGEEERM